MQTTAGQLASATWGTFVDSHREITHLRLPATALALE